MARGTLVICPLVSLSLSFLLFLPSFFLSDGKSRISSLFHLSRLVPSKGIFHVIGWQALRQVLDFGGLYGCLFAPSFTPLFSHGTPERRVKKKTIL
jgi:hypothetical protein